MVTMAQINRLDCRIDELARMLEPPPPRIQYDVSLVYTDRAGVERYSDGSPVVHKPGVRVITLRLGQDPSHGHDSAD
jgi:hypothetical protein